MTINDISQPDSKYLLKSEYGPLNPGWPVVAFSQPSFETQVRREYRTGRDFIVYLGTKGQETSNPQDRGSLISLAEIDTTRTFNTYDFLSEGDRKWAEKSYPGQWLKCFRVIRGYDILERPKASDVFKQTDLGMWHVAFRLIDEQDVLAFRNIEIVPIQDVDILARAGRPLEPIDLLRPENAHAAAEAQRLARLVFNRVGISGQIVQGRAPERSAPTNLEIQILELLLRKPLLCALCGGAMELAAANKLLRISGDRNDSKNGDYGPDNYQLVHTACNLAKNNATQLEFQEWIALVRNVTNTPGGETDV